jgi:hypothetical protein
MGTGKRSKSEIPDYDGQGRVWGRSMLLKIGLITDLHYGENTNYPKLGGEEYVNSFGEYIKIHRREITARLRNYDLIPGLCTRLTF